MKVKIGDKIYNPNEEPIMIIFDDDNERKAIAKQIKNMESKDGIRKYCQFPKDMDLNKVKEFVKL
jgi:hypothetical protein